MADQQPVKKNSPDTRFKDFLKTTLSLWLALGAWEYPFIIIYIVFFQLQARLLIHDYPFWLQEGIL